MYRVCEASPFLTEHAERLVQCWLARADRRIPGFVWNVPDPIPPIMRPWQKDELPTLEPIKHTSIQYHRKVGEHDVFLLVRDDEQVYYCPQSGKFLKNV